MLEPECLTDLIMWLFKAEAERVWTVVMCLVTCTAAVNKS